MPAVPLYGFPGDGAAYTGIAEVTMSPTIERLREEILALPSDQRQSLIASVQENAETASFELHPAWKAELRFRSEEYRAGRVEVTSLEEYERELDRAVEAE